MRVMRWLAGSVFAFVSLVALMTGCAPLSAGDGDATAGQTKFNASCASCHSAASLRGTSFLVVNNLGTLTSAMAGITLADQEVADVKAYLLTQ